MQLWEAIRSDHYQKRKRQRGKISSIKLPAGTYLGRNREEIDSKFIAILQKRLGENLTRLEASDINQSYRANLGIKIFIPKLVYEGKELDIMMYTDAIPDENVKESSGTNYVAFMVDNTITTMYLTTKTSDAEIEAAIEDNVKRERPEQLATHPPAIYDVSYAIFRVDIDGNEIKREKERIIKTTEKDEPYKVRSDYRVGSYFDHDQYGRGTVVRAAGGGKGSLNGTVDWIEVKYEKPFPKGGKVQDTRRFENIRTKAFYKKAVKESDMSIDEEKGTCCGRCGHVHAKGTSCPKPFLTGKSHCKRRTNEMHDMTHDGPDEFHQVRADVEELKNTSAGVEEFLSSIKEDPKKLKHLQDKGWYFRNFEDVEKYLLAADQKEFEELRSDFDDFIGESIDETDQFCEACLAEYLLEYEHKLEEAEYRGRKVSLGKPFLTPGGPKKRSVYVKNAKGNVVKVNFGDPNMKIKKSNPARRRSFRARHKCSNPGPRWKARYWSCKAW
jgi:hypothetical protein